MAVELAIVLNGEQVNGSTVALPRDHATRHAAT
jgi:hypothetical protein